MLAKCFYNASISLDTPTILFCSKLCWHNVSSSTWDGLHISFLSMGYSITTGFLKVIKPGCLFRVIMFNILCSVEKTDNMIHLSYHVT